MDLCTIEAVSGTSAMMVPPYTSMPSVMVMCTSQSFSVSREDTCIPLEMYFPDCSAMTESGLWIRGCDYHTAACLKQKHHISLRVTEIASPLAVTVSPGFSPLVSSKTCTVVASFFREMTSPTRFSCPT